MLCYHMDPPGTPAVTLKEVPVSILRNWKSSAWKNQWHYQKKRRKAEKDSSEYKKKARTDSKTLTNPKSRDSTTSSERRAQKRRRASVYTSLHTANPTRLYAQFLFNWNLLLPLGEYISHCHFLKHIFVLFFFLPVLGVSTRGKMFSRFLHAMI